MFKDNDLKYKIVVHPRRKFSVGHQLRMDSAFLARHGIMDYSLLLGVHRSQFLRTRASKWPVPLVRMPEPDHAPLLGTMMAQNQGRSTAERGLGSGTSSSSSASAGGVTNYDSYKSLASASADVWSYRVPSMSHNMQAVSYTHLTLPTIYSV